MGNVDQTTYKAAIDWYKRHAGEYGGTTDYNDLINKPSINEVQLIGNKTSEDLDIESSVVVSGIMMRVVGTNVEFYAAIDDSYIKTTEVDGTNIRFIL